METPNATTATAADQAEFDAQFPSDFYVTDYQDWTAEVNASVPDASQPDPRLLP